MAVRAQVDQTKQRKLNFEYWNPLQMHHYVDADTVIQRTTFVSLTQCLFHSPATSDHTQLLPEDPISEVTKSHPNTDDDVKFS